MRAVAIGLVVAFHAKVPFVSGGFVGVDVFFVLSGYLITGLLQAEYAETGGIAIQAFYARRVRRLLPAMAGMLVFTVAVGAVLFSPIEQLRFAQTALATAAYASNLLFAHRAADYWGATTSTDPLLHTWSLSVEEQFYLLWPLLFFALHRWSRRALLWATALGSLVSLILSLSLTVQFKPYAFFLPMSRAWEFGAGALLAIAGAKSSRPSKPGILAALGLVAIFGSAFAFDDDTAFPGFAVLLPVVGAILCLRAGESGEATSIHRWFLHTPVMQLGGRISYSLYLWHWPVFVVAEYLFGPPTFVSIVLILLVSLGLAVLSFRWVETPARLSLRLRNHDRRTLYGAGVVTFASLSIACAWWIWAFHAGEPDRVLLAAKGDIQAIFKRQECHANYAGIDARGCVFGDENAKGRVVLVGDSHAGSWFPPILEIAKEHSWAVISITKSVCPMVDVEVAPREVGRRYDECGIWRRQAIERIREVQPDLVVVGNATGLYAADGAGRVDPSAWLAGFARTLSELSALSKNVVVLRDVPHHRFDVPACLSRERWKGGPSVACVTDLANAFEFDPYEDERVLADSLSNVRFVDLSSALCRDGACPGVIDGVVAYRDSNHITASFALSLKPVIESALGGLFGEERMSR